MTTNCGSFRPDARAARVAAGIPTSVTAMAAAMVDQVRASNGMRQLATAHKITVATDAQVPGPGLSRPTPPNVATSIAHPTPADGSPAFRSEFKATTLAASFTRSRPGRRGYCLG